MIGLLPKTLEVEGVEYDINSDFRAALLIFEAYNDDSLSPMNKQLTLLEIIFTPAGESVPNIPRNQKEALEKAVWFLDIGQQSSSRSSVSPKTMDYVQDEQLLFSAVNAVVAKDVREEEYMHWWTFYGLCQAIDGDSLISHIMGIRSKRARGEKLEKHEQKFYSENRHLIDFKEEGFDYDEMVRQLRKK